MLKCLVYVHVKTKDETIPKHPWFVPENIYFEMMVLIFSLYICTNDSDKLKLVLDHVNWHKALFFHCQMKKSTQIIACGKKENG